VSSRYGYREDPIEKLHLAEVDQKKKPEFHSGQDYAAQAGTPIVSAASGVVVYSGFNKNLGNVVIIRNDRGDYSLYGHMQYGDRAQLGERVEEGDTIGGVGATGERVRGVHLHYSVIRPEAGKIIEKGPGNGGSIGIHLDGFTTNDPAGLTRYLDESGRAVEIMSGGNASMNSGTPSDRPGDPFYSPFERLLPVPAGAPPTTSVGQNPVAHRFGNWGSAPIGNAQLTTSDAPATFDNRFGNWGSVPTGGFGDSNSPVLRALERNRRSAAPDGSAATPVQAASLATPAFPPDGTGTGGVLGKYFDASVMPPAKGVSPSWPSLVDSTAPDFSTDETAIPNGCRGRYGTGRALATSEQAAWHLQRQAHAELSCSAADLWSAGSITRRRRR